MKTTVARELGRTDTPWPRRVVITITALLVIGDVLWYQAVRLGGPVDIDEAGYLASAFRSAPVGPLSGVARATVEIWKGGTNGPLLPMVTVPFQVLGGRGMGFSYLPNLGFFALLVFVIYGLARRFSPPWWSAFAAVLVATAPAITDYSRHYHFAVPSTALFAFSVLALVRSERFQHRTWSIAFGVGLGLTVLSRTIMVAFAPGLVLAAALACARASGAQKRRAWSDLVLSLVVALVVAGSWYLFSWHRVLDYLTGFGYGPESYTFGATSIVSFQFWFSDLVNVVSFGFYVPLAALLVLGAVVGWHSVRRTGDAFGRAWRSDAALVAVPLAVGFLALLTSRNTGSAFVLPLIPLIVVLVVALVARIPASTFRNGLVVAMLVVCAGNVAMKSGAFPRLAEPRLAWSSDWGGLPVTDGRPLIVAYIYYSDYPLGPRVDRVPPLHNGWLPAGEELARRLDEAVPDQLPDVVFTFQGAMFNTNTVLLGEVRNGLPATSLRVVPQPGLYDEIPLAAHLRSMRAAGVNAVVTGPVFESPYGNSVPSATAAAAAADAGFVRQSSVRLPDGQEAVIWVARP